MRKRQRALLYPLAVTLVLLSTLATTPIVLEAAPSAFPAAAPLVDNNNGRWFDTYGDELGIYDYDEVYVDPYAGAVILSEDRSTSGWYSTVLVRPTSFDAWGEIAVTAWYATSDALTVDVLDEKGDLVPGFQGLPLTQGAVSINGLDPATYPAIQLKVNFSRPSLSDPVPIIYDLAVTWHPISRLLLTKTCRPASVLAGQAILCTLRFSASYVDATAAVIWDTLPRAANGTVIYPVDYGQDDQPLLRWVSDNGQFCGGPESCTVAGVTVPAYSVYWQRNNIRAGQTGVVLFTMVSPNGALHGTRYLNQAHIAAANAAPVTSAQVEMVITSASTPAVEKRGGAGTVMLNYKTWAGWAGSNRYVQFVLSDPLGGGGNGNACPTGIGCQRMYNALLYDDVRDLVTAPAKVVIPNPGDVCSAFQDISGAGICNPAYTPPEGGAAFPALVWSLGTLAPGGGFYQTFAVTLVNNPVPDGWLDNMVYLDSDQTAPVSDTLRVFVGLDDTTTGTFSKGDDLDGVITHRVYENDDPLLLAQEQTMFKYILHMVNNNPVALNDIIMADIILSSTTFVAASLPPAANGAIFYATTAAYPDMHTPPPFTYTAAPGDIDLPGNNYWAAYPPPDPAAVTWIAFYIPQVSSNLFPPPDPLTTVDGEYIVSVNPLPDPCTGITMKNWGQFYAFRKTPFGGGAPLVISPPLYVEDWEVTQVSTAIPLFDLQPSQATLTPVVVAPTAETVYNLLVTNRDVPLADPALNTRVELQWSTVLANGVPAYLDFVTVSGGTLEELDLAHGRLVLNLGTLLPGDSRPVELRLRMPLGVENGQTFSVQATVTGEDDECPVPPAMVTTYGQTANATPLVQEIKDDVLDVIPSGGLLTYTLTFHNSGTGPAHNTFLADRVPDRMVFVAARGPQGELVYVSNATGELPPELTPNQPFSAATIARYFTPAVLDERGTPGDPSDDIWTSPFGESTTWVAWMVDDPALGLLPVGETRQVSFLTRNDEDRGPAQVGSPHGTLIFNEAGVWSDELLQAIGNEVITTIAEAPSLDVRKTGPSVVTAGETFAWVVTYYNNSGAPDDIVTIQDTLPDGVTYGGAVHGWNPVALAHGAPPNNNGQPVPASVVANPDGTTTLLFTIAPAYRGDDLFSLEGGTITITVQADAGLSTGTFLTNHAVGTAQNITGTLVVDTEHTTEVANADLWLRKNVDIPDPRNGDVVTFYLLISNEGAHEATNVVVQDTLPAGLVYVPGSTQVGPAAFTLGEPHVSGQALTWSTAYGNAVADQRLGRTGVLAAHSEDVFISFQAAVQGVAPGTTLTNVGTVSTATAEDGVYPNTDDAVVRTPYPDPALHKAGPDVAWPGDIVRWRLHYWNAHNEDALNAYVIDTLPDYSGDNMPDVTFVSTQAAGPSGPPAIWFHAGPTVPCPPFNPSDPAADGWVTSPTGITVAHIAYNIGLLPHRAGPYLIEVVVQLADPVTGLPVPAGVALTNRGEVFATVDEDLTNNVGEATVHTPGLDVALQKTGSTEGAYPGLVPGDPLQYTITYRNGGTVVAYGLWISDTLPGMLTLATPPDNFTVVLLTDDSGQRVWPVDATGAVITAPVPVTRVQNGSQITWYLGSTDPAAALYYRQVGVPTEARGTFTIYTQVDPTTADRTAVVNPAAITCDRRNDGEPPEEYLGNNWDDAATVVYRSDVWVDKFVQDETGSKQWTAPRHLLTYTISYNNAGSTAARDVVIEEIIPTGTTYIPGSLQAPPNTRVIFTPPTNPTTFAIEFLTPLPAPSTYDWQGSDTPGWRLQTAYHVQGNLPSFNAQNLGSIATYEQAQAVVLDANNDGAPDVAYLSPWEIGGGGGLLLNDGSGHFTKVAAGALDWVGTNPPTTVVAEDFDGDGDTDLLVRSGLLRNDGHGVFTLASRVTDRFLGAADFDRDGDLDFVAVGTAGSPQARLYLNDGTGNFAPSGDTGDLASVSAGSWNAPLVADVNADGAVDLILLSYNPGTNYVLLNNGAGHFTLTAGGDIAADILGGSGADHGALVDMNADGAVDVVLCGGIRVGARTYLNDGTGHFDLGDGGQVDDFWYRQDDAYGPIEYPPYCRNIAAADIDRDGDQDLLLAVGPAPYYGSLRVFLNDGSGHFWWWQDGGDLAARYADADDDPTGVLPFDANGDGWLDLWVSTNGYLALNTGPHFFLNAGCATCLHLEPDVPLLQRSAQPTIGAPVPSTDLVALDADGDGDMDFASGNYNAASTLYFNNGSGQFTPGEAGAFDDVAHPTYALATADFDGDGRPDLVVGNYNQPSLLYRNTGGGVFALVDAGQLDDAAYPTYALAAADFDGDGDMDIAMGNYNQSSRVFLNNGLGSFTLGTINGTAYNTYALAVFDADSDGDQDVALGNISQSCRLFRNNGSGSFTDAGSINPTAYRTLGLAAGDVDNDGDIDLVIGHNNVEANPYEPTRVFLNDGTGAFALSLDAGSLNDAAHSRSTNDVILFDVDNDGDLDLATATDQASTRSSRPSELYLNDGAGRFYRLATDFSNTGFVQNVPPSTGRAGLDNTDLMAFDADGDGDLDLVSSRPANVGESRSYYPPTVFLNHGNWNGFAGTASYYIPAAATEFTDNGRYETGYVVLQPVRPTSRYPNAGALEAWDSLLLTDDPGGGTLVYSLLNPATGLPIPGYTNLRPDATGRISLAALDPATYPTLALRADFAQGDLGRTSDLADTSPQLCLAVLTFHMAADPSFTFQVRVDDPVPTGQTTVDNTASIGTTTPEITTTNNVATDTIWLRLSDVAIDKVVDWAAVPDVGATLHYTITYVNYGPTTAYDCVLTDTLPWGIVYGSEIITPPPDMNDGSGTLRWNLGTLSVGQRGTIYIAVTLDVGLQGYAMINAAHIETSTAETNYLNNDDQAATLIGSWANVWVEKDGPAYVLVGETMTCSVAYGNSGDLAAPDVVVADTLPVGTSFVRAVPPPTSQSGQNLYWDVGTLPPGSKGMITVTVAVVLDPALVGTMLTNRTSITTTVAEVTLSDNHDEHDTLVWLALAQLSGYVWHDANEDIVRQGAEEEGLSGVTVTLLGTDFAGQPVVASATTDANGFYLFRDLLPGLYVVTETQPSGWVSTGAVEGNLGGTVFNPDRIINIPPKSGDSGWEYNFGENQNPTSVRLTYFGVRAGAQGVEVHWETASEHNNVGFQLYRNTSLEGLGPRLNESLIPSRSPGGDLGATYLFIDATALDGTTYYYHLEDVDTGGRSTLHGPVAITLWRVYLPLVSKR